MPHKALYVHKDKIKTNNTTEKKKKHVSHLKLKHHLPNNKNIFDIIPYLLKITCVKNISRVKSKK